MELSDVHVNDELTLVSDPAFRGYVVGQLSNPPEGAGPMIVMAISQPGSTNKRGHKPFPLSDLAPIKAGRGK